MITTISPDKRQEVKAKQLEVLRRLGHSDLKLDEYESTIAQIIGGVHCHQDLL
jgi:ATPase family AAA domain-containing protein 1